MWIIPTMSRPDNAHEIIKRIRENGCKSKIIVFVNGESHAKEYEIALRDFSGDNFLVYYSKENIGCIAALNKVFSWGKSDEPFYGAIFDDEFLEEGNPDDIVSAAGDWNIAHGHENWHDGKRFQGYCVIGGELARAVGYLAVPECWHHFGFDCAWEWICTQAAFGGAGVSGNILVDSVRVDRHTDGAASDSFEDDRKKFTEWQHGDLQMIGDRVRERIRSAA